MSVLRYISIIILNLLLILESSALSVFALTDADIAVNSLESLSLPIETVEQEIASEVNTNIAKEMQPELKLDIQSLLEANRAYAEKNTIATATGTVDIFADSITTPREILASLDGSSMFGDFFIISDARLLE